MDQVPPLGQLVNSYAKVERLLVARQWNAAVHLLNRRGHFRDAPEHLQPLIREAYEFVCRQEAWAAFARFPATPASRGPPTGGGLERGPVCRLSAGRAGAARVSEARRPRADRRSPAPPGPADHRRRSPLADEQHLLEAAAQPARGYRYSLHERRPAGAASAWPAIACGWSPPSTIRPSEAAIVAAWQVVQEAHCRHLVGKEWNGAGGHGPAACPAAEAWRNCPMTLPPDQRDATAAGHLAGRPVGRLPGGRTLAGFLYEQAVQRREVLGHLRDGGRGAATRRRSSSGRGSPAWPVIRCRLPGRSRSGRPAAGARRTEAHAGGLGEGAAGGVLRTVRRAAGPPRVPSDSPLTRPCWPSGSAPRCCRRRSWGCKRRRTDGEPGGRQRAGGRLARAMDVAGRRGWPTAACWPFARPSPRRPTIRRRWPPTSAWLIERPEWDRGGGSRLIRSDEAWQGACVVVWAIVDPGFQTFASRRWCWVGSSAARAGNGRDCGSFASRRQEKGEEEGPGVGGQG